MISASLRGEGRTDRWSLFTSASVSPSMALCKWVVSERICSEGKDPNEVSG